MTRRLLALLAGLAALVAVGALWVFAAPTSLGGKVDYATIVGTSMEPTLHRGDLAILRARSDYRVGDVVGYRSGDLHRVVLHRIIGVADGRYTFKGDNNDFIDSYRPTRSELVGTESVRVPVAGSVFTWLHEPVHAMLIGIVAALLLAGGTGAGAVSRRRRGRGESEQAPARRRSLPAIPEAGAWILAGALGAAALAFGVIGLLGLHQGATRVVQDGQAYLQTGTYRYGGAAKAGAVYPRGRVRTSDTVFTKLVDRLHVSFDYRFASARPHGVAGTIALAGRLTSQQGFSRVIPLAPPARFTGDRATAAGTLDLASLQKTVAAYEKSTGVQADAYTVTVEPKVHVRGVVGGQPLTATFASPPLSLGLDATKLKVLVPVQVGGNAPAPDPMHVQTAGSLPRTERGSVALPGLRLSVPTARRVGLGGAVALAVAALIAALIALRRTVRGGGSEEERIPRRYQSLIVDVATPLEAPRIVDLTSMESLGGLAEFYGRAILHHERDGVHTFGVEEDGVLHRFALGGSRPPLAAVGGGQEEPHRRAEPGA